MIVVISGPGGVGKGTIVDRLVERDPNLWLSRSWTTRARRPSETDDVYTFVTREEFVAMIDGDGFLEYTDFPGSGHLYGTPVEQDIPAGRDLLLEIEVDGAGQVKRKFPEAVVIFVVPPSREAQEQRLRARGDDEEHVQRRLAVAETEERIGRHLADHVIVNDDLDRAVEEVAGILHGYRTTCPGD